MTSIGVDAHKQVHVAVAVNNAGREIARWRGANSSDGWHDLARCATALPQPQASGIKGAWNYGRGLAQHLVGAGATVYEVTPRWTATRRLRARTLAKNDRLDALAVALLVWQDVAVLPMVVVDDESAVLDLLITEREDAVAEGTRLRNQLHQVLWQLDPEYRRHLPKLQSARGVRAVEEYTTANPSPLQQQRAGTVRRLAQRLRLVQEQAKASRQRFGCGLHPNSPP